MTDWGGLSEGELNGLLTIMSKVDGNGHPCSGESLIQE